MIITIKIRMKNTEEIPVKSYSLSELSQLFSPSLSLSATTKQLLRWMLRHPNLVLRLQETGWQKGGRRFSPKQIPLLFDCIGPPWAPLKERTEIQISFRFQSYIFEVSILYLWLSNPISLKFHSYIFESSFLYLWKQDPASFKNALLALGNVPFTKLKHRHVLMQNKFQYDNNT